MKEKPILMKGPMVVAILNDLKTQTRRVVRNQDCVHGPCKNGTLYWIPAGMRGDPEPNYPAIRLIDKNPHGQPGDRLWVKETWKPVMESWRSYIEYRADLGAKKCVGEDTDRLEELIKRSKGALRFEGAVKKYHSERWRPSIFMYRWASRIDLEVLEVRVQRLQDISEADAVAEGVDPGCGNCGENSLPNGCGCSDPEPLPVDSFIYLWNSINRKPKPVLVKKKVVSYISYPWEDIRETREHRGLPWRVHGNPAVFANTFRRVRP